MTNKKLLDEKSTKEVKFDDPYNTANDFVDIIAPTFGLTRGIKIAIKTRLKLSKKEELKQCLLDVLKFLIVEYKK